MWRTEGNGRAEIYQDGTTSVRLRLHDVAFGMQSPPDNGTCYIVQAIVGDPATAFDLSVARVTEIASGDTWLCPPADSVLPFHKKLDQQWDEWAEAHPELTWEGRRVKVA